MYLKFIFLSVLVLLSLNELNGQPPEKSKIYLSVSLGPSFTAIKNEFSFYTYNLNGASLQLDLKAGFGLSHNLFMHAIYMVNRLSNPNIKVPSRFTPRPSEELALQDRMVGGGFTWYPIPALYLSASAGPGTIKLIDKADKTESTVSDRGPSLHFSLGREWRVAESFGMGLCFTYGFTKTTNLTYRGDEELKSNRFSLLYSVSMH
jgi:hypothetical protein